MTNQQINTAFLAAVDSKVRTQILDNIANHYGCTRGDAYEEVTHESAEHLLDYITGPERAATSLLMQRYKGAK